jgi:hypothetical protein
VASRARPNRGEEQEVKAQVLHRSIITLGILAVLFAPVGVALTYGPSAHGLSVLTPLSIQDHGHRHDHAAAHVMADAIQGATPIHDATDH